VQDLAAGAEMAGDREERSPVSGFGFRVWDFGLIIRVKDEKLQFRVSG